MLDDGTTVTVNSDTEYNDQIYATNPPYVVDFVISLITGNWITQLGGYKITLFKDYFIGISGKIGIWLLDLPLTRWLEIQPD